MKIVKNRWTNFLLIILSLSLVTSSEIGFGMFKKSRSNMRKAQGNASTDPKQAENPTPTPKQENAHKVSLPDLPVYYQGWLKYLHFTAKDEHAPKAFYKNSAFNEQARENITAKDLNEKDENSLQKIKDTLDISYIKPIPEDDNFTGGLRNFGRFNEGFCFKVLTKIPLENFAPTPEKPSPDKGQEVTWVFCLNEEKDKTELMETIINLKLRQQHDNGIYLQMNAKDKSLHQQGSVENMNELKKDNLAAISKPTTLDGYWILLQDWSQCTLKCGGGEQFQQLMCVPHKKGGQPCKGDKIRKRPCNTQPCPEVRDVKKVMHSPEEKKENSLPPVVKMMSVSSRPQRYDKCVIKETDVLMELVDDNTKSLTVKPRIPVRLILNDKTACVYVDDNLSTRKVCYNLNETNFLKVNNEDRCFKLANTVRSSMFCQLDSSSPGDFIEEMKYDFNLFKHQCHKPRPKSDTLLSEDKKLEEEYKNKVEHMKLELVEEKAQMAKKKAEEKEEVELHANIEKAHTTSLMAMQKETKLEELLEKEEAAREDEETKQLETQIESEKKKEECLNKAIKEKQTENQYNMEKAKAAEAIKKIQEEAKKKVIVQRAEIKRKIAEMRKKQERKKANLRNEVMRIRNTIAKKLTRVSKAGDASKCTKGAVEAERLDYCQKNFPDDYIKYDDCKNESSFCYVCCENEFGDFHIKDRDDCETKCNA